MDEQILHKGIELQQVVTANGKYWLIRMGALTQVFACKEYTLLEALAEFSRVVAL